MSNKLVSNYKIQYIALKIKLYPTEEQKIYFNKTFGCARSFYNHLKAEKDKFYQENNLENIADKNERNRIWKTFKSTTPKEYKEKFPYCKEADSQAFNTAEMDFKTACKNMYEDIAKAKSGILNWDKVRITKFHSKKSEKQSYKTCMMKQNCLDWNEHTITIPKIKKVRFKNNQAPKWYKYRTKTRSITISRNASMEYFASILFEVRLPDTKRYNQWDKDESKVIGLDFDCNDMYIDSNGKSALKDFGFKKQKQNSKQLKHRQRQLARKCKNSKRREKARIKLAQSEAHVANARKDWSLKHSIYLARNYEVIAVEDLNIKEMMKGSRNAKNYQDISWSTFIGNLQQQSRKYNCQVIKTNKWYASSQICHICGFKNVMVQKRHLEEYFCPNCMTRHQRDENAAINIKNKSIRVLREAEEKREKGSVKRRITCQKDHASSLSTKKLTNLPLT